MKEISFHLVLSGSFFPLHEGHLNLIEAGRNYIINLPQFSGWDVSVSKVHLFPTHPKSLAKKHKLENMDYWQSNRIRQMSEFIEQRKVFKDVQTFILQNEEEMVPMAKYISKLRSDIELLGNDNVHRKLIQISGVDSRVQSIIKSCQKAKNSHFWIDGLNLVLVIDGRGVPEENREIVDTFKHVTKIVDCPTLSAKDYLPRSSTIQRVIQQNVYYENVDCDIMYEQFDCSWLLDTGVNLGKGREGIVRLMMLGGHAYVAVKIIRLSRLLYPKHRFVEESTIWRRLAKISPNTIPRVFTTKIVKTKESEEFGIIVTEVGIALDKIFPNLKIDPSSSNSNRKKSMVDNEHFKSCFDHFKCISAYTKRGDLPFQPASFVWLKYASKMDLEKVKIQVHKSLLDSILPGLLKADVVHKDLKIDNILYVPSSNKVVVCDFGVSVLRNGKMDPGPRGAMKYYPTVAYDNPNIYEPWCDSYFASLSLFEILTETKLFPDLNPSHVFDLRRKGIYPTVDNDVEEKFRDGFLWIRKEWKEEEGKRWPTTK